MALAPGVEIGRYVIEEKIGDGGMGEVYRARDLRLSRDVAIKILMPELACDRLAVARFQREAIAASALNHPHILHVYDAGEQILGEGLVSFIAMELIEGTSLRAAVAGSPDLSRTIALLMQIGEALSKAHGAGIIHRDLKPENIMVTNDGYAKVLDFGLAKLQPISEETAKTDVMLMRTSAGVVMGTAGYMAPEQAEGRPVDSRSDIFSFGCILFEASSGRPPFHGSSLIDILHNTMHAEPEYDLLPSALQPIARRCLAKSPASRYEGIDGVISDLRRVLEGSLPSTLLPATKRSRKQIDSIAVLPFVNVSSDARSDYLSEGIAETLINGLSHLPKLRVVPRSTVFRYKNRDDIGRIAAELSVRALLSGRVMLRDDGVTISVELIDAVHDSQIWGEQYNGPVAGLLELQKTIAQDVAHQLRPKASGHTRRQVITIHTDDPEAYQLYLKGRYHLNKRSPDSLRKSIEFFQKAIDRDPVYARGYAGLADAWVLLGWYSVERPGLAFPRALAAARQAVAMDPSFAEAVTSAAYATFLSQWDSEGAEQEFLRALSLNPHYSIAHHWYADLLQATGRATEAVVHARRACEIDPLALILNAEVGRAYYYARQFDQAIEQQVRTLELEPAFAPSLLFLGQAYDQSGRLSEAVEAFRKGAAASQDNPIYLGYYGYALGRLGLADEAHAIRERLAEGAGTRWVPAFSRVLVALGLGDRDDTRRWLEAALEEGAHWLLYTPVDPAFEMVWADQKFASVLSRIKSRGTLERGQPLRE